MRYVQTKRFKKAFMNNQTGKWEEDEPLRMPSNKNRGFLQDDDKFDAFINNGPESVGGEDSVNNLIERIQSNPIAEDYEAPAYEPKRKQPSEDLEMIERIARESIEEEKARSDGRLPDRYYETKFKWFVEVQKDNPDPKVVQQLEDELQFILHGTDDTDDNNPWGDTDEEDYEPKWDTGSNYDDETEWDTGSNYDDGYPK